MNIEDVTPDDLVLPGDCLGGAVLRGWNGLAEQRTHTAAAWHSVFLRGPVVNGDVQWVRVAPYDPAFGRSGAKFVRVFCTLPGFRDHLRRVLAAGERCERCHGTDRITGRVTWPDADCERCNGTGYTRQPHDLGRFTDDEIAGRITPLAAAGLMWASALRVEAGEGPVVGPATCGSEDASALLDSHRLSVAHYALYSPNRDHILLPLPDRIARLRLTDNSAPGGREEA